MNWCILVLMVFCWRLVNCKNVTDEGCCDEETSRSITNWEQFWPIFSNTAQWSPHWRIPMTLEFADTSRQDRGHKNKFKKRVKRIMLPLLLAYKLKFFTLVPVLMGGLILLTGATGMAGFFFALFAAVMGLKTHGGRKRR